MFEIVMGIDDFSIQLVKYWGNTLVNYLFLMVICWKQAK